MGSFPQDPARFAVCCLAQKGNWWWLLLLVSSKANALALAAKANDHSKNEVKAGNPVPFPREGIHLSPIGFITRKNWPRKFRLIVNLSFPSGHSINNAINNSISPAHFSHYITEHHATELIPQGSTFAKTDLKAAFRRVGISWRNHTILCNRVLLFSLRSALNHL